MSPGLQTALTIAVYVVIGLVVLQLVWFFVVLRFIRRNFKDSHDFTRNISSRRKFDRLR